MSNNKTLNNNRIYNSIIELNRVFSSFCSEYILQKNRIWSLNQSQSATDQLL